MVFDVNAEGKDILNSWDTFYYTMGHDKAKKLGFYIDVSDGQLNVDFVPVTNGAQVNSILVQMK